jgi:hypothetical protein
MRPISPALAVLVFLVSHGAQAQLCTKKDKDGKEPDGCPTFELNGTITPLAKGPRVGLRFHFSDPEMQGHLEAMYGKDSRGRDYYKAGYRVDGGPLPQHTELAHETRPGFKRTDLQLGLAYVGQGEGYTRAYAGLDLAAQRDRARDGATSAPSVGFAAGIDQELFKLVTLSVSGALGANHSFGRDKGEFRQHGFGGYAISDLGVGVRLPRGARASANYVYDASMIKALPVTNQRLLSTTGELRMSVAVPVR